MRRLSLTLAALVLATLVGAEVLHPSGLISVTSTSATTTLDKVVNLTLTSHSSSANEMYVRVFHCGDTSAAATTNDIEIPVGQSVVYVDHKRAYCAVSYVTAAAETAKLAYQAQK